MIAGSCQKNNPKWNLVITMTSALLLFYCNLCSQNYVLNPSFEKSNGCPDDFFQIDKCTNWFSPYCESYNVRANGKATYFTGVFPCNNALTNVPQNIWTHQFAHSGSSYAGILIVNSKVVYTE